MQRVVALAAGLAAFLASAAMGQEPQLAPEGRGLLPAPTAVPATLGGTPPAHPFEPDPSGGFSRIVFETDEDPNFKLVIRDYSFPPDQKTHTVTLPAAAVLHVRGETGEITVAKKPLALTEAARAAVPANAPIEVTNRGERDLVVRVITVEGKRP